MTDDRFEEVVLKSELPVMVDFGATWCGPCKKVEPIVEEISEEYAGRMVAVKCDVEECPDTAAKFGIMNIPTVVDSLSTRTSALHLRRCLWKNWRSCFN